MSDLNKKKIKNLWTFFYSFQYQDVQRGNQHGGHEYNDLQNWFDMTSHENPLLYLAAAMMWQTMWAGYSKAISTM